MRSVRPGTSNQISVSTASSMLMAITFIGVTGFQTSNEFINLAHCLYAVSRSVKARLAVAGTNLSSRVLNSGLKFSSSLCCSSSPRGSVAVLSP